MTATTFIGSITKADSAPPEKGQYMLLAWEWVGLYSERPRDPAWYLRQWDGKAWQAQRYYFDTGGYENFEPYAWSRLPPTRPQFQEP